MTVARTGRFVSIDGPSGVGKTITIEALSDHLAERDISALMTVEPTTSPLGRFIRSNADHIRGRALACLVVGDRYNHIDAEIGPALRAGKLIISDRYLPSTLVLQQLDGVPREFLLAINGDVLMPDLAVILTARPGLIANRISESGTKHRFRRDPTAPHHEVELYAEAAAHLMNEGVKVLLLDTSDATPSDVARRIADAIVSLPLASVATTRLHDQR